MAESSACSTRSTSSLASEQPVWKPLIHTSPPRWSGLSKHANSKRNSDPLSEPSLCSEVSGPHLVNYGTSRSNCSVSFLQLPISGTIIVGTPDKDKPPDIPIEGAGVERNHAKFVCSPERIVLVPHAAATTIDGLRCTEPHVLQRGSMICFGRSYHFKYMCPQGFMSSPDRLSLPAAGAPDWAQVYACDNPQYFEMSYRSDGGCVERADYNSHEPAGILQSYENVPPMSASGISYAPFSPSASECRPSSEKAGLRDVNCNVDAHSNSTKVACKCESPECGDESKQKLGSVSAEFRPLTTTAVVHRQSISPNSHTRIKTNGSLAKDPSSPLSLQVSSLDTSIHGRIQDDSGTIPRSPRTRIRTTLNRAQSNSSTSQSPDHCLILNDTQNPFTFSNGECARMTKTCCVAHTNNSAFQSSDSHDSSACYVNSGIDRETMAAIQRDEHILSCQHSPDQLSPMTVNNALYAYSKGEDPVGTIDVYDGGPEYINVCTTESRQQRNRLENVEAYEQLKKEKILSYKHISELRDSKLELEHQESETIRQVEVEHALLDGEIEVCLEKIESIEESAGKQRSSLELATKNWQLQRQIFSREIEILESRMHDADTCLKELEDSYNAFSGSQEKKSLIADKLKEQRGVVEHERKLHEDTEFQFMEAEAVWETDKEEMVASLSQTDKQIADLKEKITDIKRQQKNLVEGIRSDASQLEMKRQEILRQMCLERDRLRDMKRQLSQLAYPVDNVLVTETSVQDEYELSSDTEYISNEYIEARLHHLQLLGNQTDATGAVHDGTTDSAIETSCDSPSTLRHCHKKLNIVVDQQASQAVDQDENVAERLKDATKQQPATVASTGRGQQTGAQTVTRRDSLDSVGGGDSSQSEPAASAAVESCSTAVNDDQHTATTAVHDAGRARPVSDVSSVFEGVEQPAVQSACRRSRASLCRQQQQQRPLTRYLPIADSRLDLRAHIESAAHQLDSHSDVQVTASSCRGFLLKLSGGGGGLTRWRRRWFVFERARDTRALLYYGDSGERRVRGGAHFGAIEEVYVDHTKRRRAHKPACTFCVKTTGRLFTLMAASAASMRIWVDVVMTGAEGYLSSYCNH